MNKPLRHWWLYGAAALALLLAPVVYAAISVAQPVGAGIKIDAATSAPSNCSASPNYGCPWMDQTDGKLHLSYNGTDTALGSGGAGSTGNWTFSGDIATLNHAGTSEIDCTAAGSSGINTVYRLKAINDLTAGGGTWSASFENNNGTDRVYQINAIAGVTTVNLFDASTNTPLGRLQSDSAAGMLLRPHDQAGTNVAGLPLTIRGGLATGNAASGDAVIQYAPAGSSGTTAETAADALRVNGSTGAVTFSRPINVPANASISGAASATNTTALTTTTNVADGATSVAEQHTNTTAITSGGLLSQWTNGANIAAAFQQTSGTITWLWGAGSVGALGTNSGLRLSDGSGTILKYATQSVEVNTDVNGPSFHVSGADVVNIQASAIEPAVDVSGYSSGDVSHRWSSTNSQEYLGISNTVAFSATPAINCAAGETVHVGPITGNVTGATMTGGGAGEECTVIALHDGTTTAFTWAWSGTNVRSTSTTTAGVANSLTIYHFRWDDHLSTPAWVQQSAAINVN